MHAFQSWILEVATQWWVHPLVAILSLVDGFFPTVPSESVLISLGSLFASQGAWLKLGLLVLAGWVGAAVGDHVAYAIGARLGWERFRLFRSGKGRAVIEAAERGLERRAFTYLMTARFIPLGRTAVNLVAGAVGYPRNAFTHRIILATCLWAAYSTSIGALAGSWFHMHPLAGIAVALAVALVLSVIVENLVRRLHARKDHS